MMHARHLWALVCVACWPAASLAAFDPTDVVQIQASATLYRDTNLFRIPDDIDSDQSRVLGVKPGKNIDTARILGVGLKLDKILSRQRLIADLNLNDTTYDRNTDLNYSGGDGRLAWLWQAGNYWSGEASYRKKRSLGGFGDQTLRVQDLIDIDTYSLTGGYQFHPRWRIAAELTEVDVTHSAVIRQNLNYDSQLGGVTLTYRTPADNSIGLQARQTDRSYPSAPVDDHTETRLNALAAWRFSGPLKLDAQVGHADVKHDRRGAQNFDRDFSGVTWRAGATWDATAKFRLSLTSSKDVRLYEDTLTSYVVVNSVGVSPVYALTPKVALQGDFSFENREYRGSPVQNREDNVRLLRIALSYTPVRYLDFTLSFETGDRKSNVLFTGIVPDFSSGTIVPFVNVPINNYDYQSWFGMVRVSF
jgi:exopolysaccharide biosynthesis operon protein EpsL